MLASVVRIKSRLFFYLVGRLTLNVFSKQRTQYSLSGISAPEYEIWPAISATRLAGYKCYTSGRL